MKVSEGYVFFFFDELSKVLDLMVKNFVQGYKEHLRQFKKIFSLTLKNCITSSNHVQKSFLH